MAEQTGECKTQIFKVIRLTELIDPLLDKVDSRGLAFSPAVEISYLTYEEQRIVADCMERHVVKPSFSQAVRLKKLKQDGTLNAEIIDSVLAEEKKPPCAEESGSARFRRYFPPEYSPKQINTVIINLLKEWKARAAIL
jgi:ParB family chromosome partitioning protein